MEEVVFGPVVYLQSMDATLPYSKQARGEARQGRRVNITGGRLSPTRVVKVIWNYIHKIFLVTVLCILAASE